MLQKTNKQKTRVAKKEEKAKTGVKRIGRENYWKE
jgi:hypothetical protein